MSSPFGPSPRASKRRRTTYGTQRTALADQDGADIEGDTIDVNGHRSVSKENVTPVKSTKAKAMSRSTNSKLTSENTATISVTVETDPDTPSRSGRSKSGCNPEQKTTASSELQQDESANSTPQPRSSGRQRRAPRRLDDALAEPEPVQQPKQTKPKTKKVQKDNVMIDSTPTSPILKGILTPSKRQRNGLKKSVMFSHDDKELEEQLGFRDINTPAPAKSGTRRATPHPKRTRQVQPEPEDDGEVFRDAVEVLLPVPVVPAVNVSIAKARPQTTIHDDDYTRKIRTEVLSRLTSRSLPSKPPENLSSQYKQIHTLLTATIVSSESNSMLLLGPRESGKSMLLDLALNDLSTTYASDFHTVRLSGFLQTDDRLALREIWRQLGHDRGLDDAETEDIGASYADTMSSLLSLLSHPEEMGMEQATSKSIVFILDEFDLFTTHPRQTLLYNLFDIAQSRKAPITVIGCSTRMDVIECLEKRVKSRFSHRWVLVPGCKNLKEWEACIAQALMIEEDEMGKRSLKEEDVGNSWNEAVKELLASTDTKRLVNMHYYSSKSLPALFMDLFSQIAVLQPGNVSTSGSISKPPSVLTNVTTLPVLHLSLLVASCRLTTIYHLATPNFNLVHAHYSELIKANRLKQVAGGAVMASGSLRQWNRELCRGVWEELANLGLLVSVNGGDELGKGTGGEGEEDTRMWRAEVDLDDMEWSVRQRFAIEGDGRGSGGAGEVLMKWCREV